MANDFFSISILAAKASVIFAAEIFIFLLDYEKIIVK